jgi:2-phosphosulfolactate phosphatase
METENEQDLPAVDDENWHVPLNWGPRGLDALAVACDAVIIVDVLSFSTSVDIALTAGATVFPCGDHNEARVLAASVRGVPAARRGEPGWSLSPASLSAIPPGTRFVLAAVNGGAVAARAISGRRDLFVFVACLRNMEAVATAVRALARRPGLVAAGERRRDGNIRFAREDWLGAGALADALRLPLTPKAAAAADSFRKARGDIEAALLATRSGRELADRGFAHDVRLAAEIGVSATVPQLEGKVIVPGPRGARGSVTHRWFDGPKLRLMPARRGDKNLVLAEVLRRLDLRGEIPEAQLNELLKTIHPDFCTLRRELVDTGLLARERGIYWRVDSAASSSD